MKKIKGDIFNTDTGVLIMLIRTQLNEVIDAVNELQERVDDIIATQNAVIDRMEIQRSDVEPAKKEDKPPFEDRLSDLVTASRYRNAKLVDAIVALAEEHFGKEKK